MSRTRRIRTRRRIAVLCLIIGAAGILIAVAGICAGHGNAHSAAAICYGISAVAGATCCLRST